MHFCLELHLTTIITGNSIVNMDHVANWALDYIKDDVDVKLNLFVFTDGLRIAVTQTTKDVVDFTSLGKSQ
jgi:hypothetical protein